MPLSLERKELIHKQQEPPVNGRIPEGGIEVRDKRGFSMKEGREVKKGPWNRGGDTTVTLGSIARGKGGKGMLERRFVRSAESA